MGKFLDISQRLAQLDDPRLVQTLKLLQDGVNSAMAQGTPGTGGQLPLIDSQPTVVITAAVTRVRGTATITRITADPSMSPLAFLAEGSWFTQATDGGNIAASRAPNPGWTQLFYYNTNDTRWYPV